MTWNARLRGWYALPDVRAAFEQRHIELFTRWRWCRACPNNPHRAQFMAAARTVELRRLHAD